MPSKDRADVAADRFVSAVQCFAGLSPDRRSQVTVALQREKLIDGRMPHAEHEIEGVSFDGIQ